MALDITAAAVDPALLDLPWDVPLEEWPSNLLAALPRGISRHIVRFVNLSGRVLAVKEIGPTVAHHEYDRLRDLKRLDAPSVQPVAVITGRESPEGEELNAALITEHLQFSLPYRALFSLSMREDTATRLIDALALLLVRLTSSASTGATSPCRTRCSAATRVSSPPTWSTPKPANYTPSSPPASASTTST